MEKCHFCKFNLEHSICKNCEDYDHYKPKYVIPNLDNVLGLNKDRKEIAESPALQFLHDPDSNPVYSLTHNFIAKVVTAENKAIVDEIKEWARIKGNTTVIEMDEERLMKIIELGSRELERLEQED